MLKSIKSVQDIHSTIFWIPCTDQTQPPGDSCVPPANFARGYNQIQPVTKSHHLPRTLRLTLKEFCPPLFSARHVYTPASSGDALVMINEWTPSSLTTIWNTITHTLLFKTLSLVSLYTTTIYASFKFLYIQFVHNWESVRIVVRNICILTFWLFWQITELRQKHRSVINGMASFS